MDPVQISSRQWWTLDAALLNPLVLWTSLLMMSMSFMPDSFNAPDPSKSAFLEFGHGLPTHQTQHSPGLSHNIYPVHGLQTGGHLQHDAPFQSAAYSYGRSLGYAYPGSVSSHTPNAYVPYQHSNQNNSLAHAKVEEPGKSFKRCYHLDSNRNYSK